MSTEETGNTAMRCTYHPKVETNLRCSKCEKPICPKCMVYTPVGARCPDCAALKRIPIYDVSTMQYARAIAAGIGLAIVGGFIWGLIGSFGFFFTFIIALLVGYIFGEAVSRSAGYKRGLGLQIVAGFSVLLAFVFRALLPVLLNGPTLGLGSDLMLAYAGASVMHMLNNPWNLIALGLAVFMAVRRL